MRKADIYTGINIQYPISRLILEGKKTIETRTYPIPKAYIGRDLVIIETPGKTGKFRARIVGFVKFGESFSYKDERSFYKDQAKHCVSPDSQWKWIGRKGKWGWPILSVESFSSAKPAPSKKGIKFTKNIAV